MEKPPESKSKETVKIGIIIGAGTGRRLADVFKGFLEGLVLNYSGKVVKFEEAGFEEGKPYHSYKTIVDEAGGQASKFDAISQAEAEQLVKTTEQWYRSGIKTIFRTSINAEALYLFRQKVEAIKEFGLETNSGGRILFVRDQAEGFYANTKYEISAGFDEIFFSGKFTRHHHHKVALHALKAAKQFMKGRPYQKWAIYKHHLFGDLFQKWLREIDPSILAYQPDTGLTKLNKVISDEQKMNNGHQPPHNILIICSNEVGDIIYETILGVVNIEAELELYTRNVYTAKPFAGKLFEYQTVHGSADDIEGTEKILPYATLRIAADIAERNFKVLGTKQALEFAISEAKRKRIDETTSILNHIFHHFQIKSTYGYQNH